MEKKDAKTKHKGAVKSTSIKKTKWLLFFGITLTTKNIHIKLNELI